MKRIGLFFILIISSQICYADFINLIQADKCETILEVFVNEHVITAKLEVGELDYQWFSDAIPQEYFKEGFTAANKQDRWASFLKNQFVSWKLYLEISKAEKILFLYKLIILFVIIR